MRKGWILIAVIIALTAAFFMTERAEEDTVTIGVLLSGENRIDKLDGIKDGLEELGYEMDGISFIIFEGEEDAELLEPYAKQLVIEEEPDVIASFGGIETQVLAEVMEEENHFIPTVFVGMAAPLETGIIEDFREPGGPFTGVSNFHMNLSAKRLELFTDIIGGLERVILIYSDDIDISRRSLALTEEAADTLGVQIEPFHLSGGFDKEALEDVLEEEDGLMTLPSYQVEAFTDEIVSFALENSVPVMGIYDYEVEAGFLFGYGSSFYGQGFQAARHISLILQGNSPGDIPVELPDQIPFFINGEVSEQLNLELDENLLKLTEPVKNGGGGGE
ncbi:ABC transporter substrate-binding protein [Salipaludibacillus aurantiacus]|uniref:Putative ABC transport system substrate-binding protein n=1 Tax=Salipaludibacillus aurantiacus TaxID=1601833 RepID=A0A1H9TZP0_9BACI|nr:ABC transporter substrate-binding protein [Salipaludibacillus aurantiacus]SES02367.1 putative ABC transport system substrate-binding protein [Salipaludibacillus aurantiacus]